MKPRGSVRLMTVLVLFVSMFTLDSRPTSATSTGSLVFSATSALTGCAGLGYPGIPTTTTTPPLINVRPASCSIGVLSATCVNAVANGLDKTPAPTLTAGAGCVVSMGGTISGYCGLSFGSWSGVIIDNTGSSANVAFNFDNVGNIATVKGVVAKGAQRGLVAGVMEVLDPSPLFTPQGGSCAAGNNTFLTFFGTLTFEMT